jgi:hypothetical protein
MFAATSAHADKWLRANFHAHTQNQFSFDDGSEPPLEMHRALRQAGFDFSLHSAHSTYQSFENSPERFRLQRVEEASFDVPGLTIALGEELSVAPGPRYQKRTKILGHDGPSNLNHLTLLGIQELVPTGTPLKEACERAHDGGGACIVNHPGPGPMMWEEGLWEKSGHVIDGLEVYNGEAMALLGLSFESRYLEATAYSQLGMKIAAVSGADTHGPESFSRSRAQLRRAGPATKLLSLVLPPARTARPELDAATLVQAAGSSEREVVEAVRARKTVATWALPNLRVECRGLGEVRHSDDVDLKLSLSRNVEEIVLYREGVAVKSWKNASEAVFQERVSEPAAYVFGVRDGSGRLLTSAIWYSATAKPHGAGAR